MEHTAREAEVLALLGAHLSNAQIAGRLHMSVRTVEGHVSTLLRKYGVADRKALAAMGRRASGPPRARTTFVGRAHEREAIAKALGGHRLVTLLGPGGVGKTRLAAVVADDAASSFPYGVAFADLVPAGPEFLAQAVASALDVAERPGQPLEDAIAERVGTGRTLLILDNCEHLIDAAAALVEHLLSACPQVVVLTTSRERLGVPGERVIGVEPLPLDSDAERLFNDRAGFEADPAAVADLCARLDGLPLAIELAAARSASLGTGGLLTGLGDYLRLLAGGRGPAVRHRSLRTVIGWSHELLDEEERALFRRLAVFSGSFDLDAVAHVGAVGGQGVAADLLGRLVDKSLVIRRAERWHLLATIRAFAAEQLETSGERPAVAEQHLRWAAGTASAMESRMTGRWREDFDAVAADLRAALAAAPKDHAPPQGHAAPQGHDAHRLARSLGRLTYARRFLVEALDHYRGAAERAPSPSDAYADLRCAADCAQVLHDTSRAYDLQLEAAERAQDGNARAVALAHAVELAGRFPGTFSAEVPREHLTGLLSLAAEAGDPGHPVVAVRLACAAAWIADPGRRLAPDPALGEQAVAAARATGDAVLISAALDTLRTSAATTGQLREAHRISRERLALLPLMDRDDLAAASEIDDIFGTACADAIAVGDLPAARSTVELLMEDDLLGEHPYLSTSKVIPAVVLTGDFEQARRLATTMWESWERAGRPPAFWMQTAVLFTALAYALDGDRAAFAVWRERAGQVSGGHNPHAAQLAPLAAFVEARAALHSGELADAERLVERAFTPVDGGRFVPYARAAGAELAIAAGLGDAETRLAEAAGPAAENAWAAACLARAGGDLTASIAAWERIGAAFEASYTRGLGGVPY